MRVLTCVTCAAVLISAAILGRAVWAQDFVEQIAAERARRLDASLSSAQRLASIERALEARRQLIRSRPNDAEQAVWMADQASDIFFERLALDGLEIAALFGSLPPDQQSAASRAAREMHEMASQAELAIGQAIVDVEASPNFRDDLALQERRRALIEVERDRRIPFLRGVAAVLHAELNVEDDEKRRPLYRDAIHSLTPLIEALQFSAPALAAQARLYCGLAQARRGEFEAAESLFDHVAHDAASTPIQIFTAKMGRVINRTQRGGPHAGLEAIASMKSAYPLAHESANVFFRTVIADHHHARLMQAASGAATKPRPSDLNSAFEPYIELWRMAGSEPAKSADWRDSLQSLVLGRMGQAVQNAMAHTALAPEHLPPVVAVAYADHLARDAQNRLRAIEMLEDFVERHDVDEGAKAAGLFALGRALYEHGQLYFAARRFIEFGSSHASHYQSARAMELGVSIAADVFQKSPDDREVRQLLQEGVAILLARYPNLTAVDRWRYLAGRLALDDQRFEDADRILAQITPEAEPWLDAQFMRVAVQRGRALAAAEIVERKRNEDVLLGLIDQVRKAIDAALSNPEHEHRAAILQGYLGRLRVFRAEAQNRLGQHRAAIETLAGIEEADDPAGTNVRAQGLKVRINAYQAQGQNDAAAREMQKLVEYEPEHAAETLLPIIASMQSDVEALVAASRDSEATELAKRTLMPVAEILERWLAAPPAGSAVTHRSDQARCRVADAYRYSGRFSDALIRYESLLKDQPDAADLLLGKAESLFGAGSEPHLAQAMEIYKRLAAAGADAGGETFWLAQLRMLQILDRVQRHLDHIAPRIERLRQQDGNFGGERFRRGFEALRQKHWTRAS